MKTPLGAQTTPPALINSRAATWTADHHPADHREQQQRWDRLLYARVAIIVAGFVLTLVAGTVA